MAKLGGKLSCIEIPNPLRIGLRVAPLEFPRRLGESIVTRFRIAQPGESTASMASK